ncbi:MAG: lipopolysaccharide biosynthesis protein [Bradymonadaceae bacterium]
MDASEGQQYLDTEHLEGDLGSKSVWGAVMQSISQGGRSLIDMGATIALARLLTPEDFGLLGMVVAVTGFLEMFKDMGLSAATVQREEITHEQVTTLMWVNVGISVLLMIGTAAAAPVLAWFYEEPRLFEITIVFSATFLFGGLMIQHEAILRRQMRFTELAALNFVELVLSVSLAISLAAADFGYWALVARSVFSSFAMAAGVWLLCGWRPASPRIADGSKELLTFGGHLTGYSLLNYLSRHFDDILIGRYFGAQPLGLFRKAHDILKLPLTEIRQPISSVSKSLLARLLDRPEKYRRTYVRILEKLLMVTLPLGAYMLGTADWLIAAILGEHWLDATPIFIALGVGLFYQPATATTGWLFISQDRTDQMMRWGAIGSVLSIASFVAGLPFGVVGVAAFYSISGLVIRAPVLIWYVTREGPVRQRDFYETIAPFLGAAAAVGLAMYGLRTGYDIGSPYVGALVGLGVTLVVTPAFLLLLPSGRRAIWDVGEIVQLLREHSDDDDSDDEEADEPAFEDPETDEPSD